MNVELWIAVVGALGVGGILQQIYSGSRQRREARAEVMRRVFRFEQLMASGHLTETDPAMTALDEAYIAGMLARLHRPTIERFRELGVARVWVALIPPAVMQTIEVSFRSGQARSLMLAQVTFAAWHPWLARIRRKRLKGLAAWTSVALDDYSIARSKAKHPSRSQVWRDAMETNS